MHNKTSRNFFLYIFFSYKIDMERLQLQLLAIIVNHNVICANDMKLKKSPPLGFRQTFNTAILVSDLSNTFTCIKFIKQPQ